MAPVSHIVVGRILRAQRAARARGVEADTLILPTTEARQFDEWLLSAGVGTDWDGKAFGMLVTEDQHATEIACERRIGR